MVYEYRGERTLEEEAPNVLEEYAIPPLAPHTPEPPREWAYATEEERREAKRETRRRYRERNRERIRAQQRTYDLVRRGKAEAA